MSNRVVCPSHPDANLIEDCHAGEQFLQKLNFPEFPLHHLSTMSSRIDFFKIPISDSICPAL